ncbi:MAG: DUF4395 domain-containing protein [Myxococcaceae bacterium]
MATASRGSHTFLTSPWWAMGQAVPELPGPRVNETATRARAGMLNVLSATTLFVLLTRPDLDPVLYVGPLVIFDMFAAALTGLTPLSPVGIVGTVLTLRLRPLWKPSQPKRFAWILGGTLGLCCLAMRLLHAPTSWLVGVIGTCFVLTWLEAALGFCVGCWMYSLFAECEACDLPYRRGNTSTDKP